MSDYASLDDMWEDCVGGLLSRGVRPSERGPTREVFGWHGRLDAGRQQTWLTNRRRALDPAYAAAETLWYLSRTPLVEMLLHYAPQYIKFAETDDDYLMSKPRAPYAYGAYGHRIGVGGMSDDFTNAHKTDQLYQARDLLRKTPDTRQCRVQLWEAGDLHVALNGRRGKKVNDLPCTGSLTFLLRDGLLNMSAEMRSNDAWLGMPYDVFAFTCVQRLLADELGVGVGQYSHYAVSMHLYEKNAEAAAEALEHAKLIDRQFVQPHGWESRCGFTEVPIALDQERVCRLWPNNALNVDMSRLNVGDMLRDLVYCCESGNHYGRAPGNLSQLANRTKSPALARSLIVHGEHRRRVKEERRARIAEQAEAAEDRTDGGRFPAGDEQV